MKNTTGQNCDRNCLPGNPSISRTNLEGNGEKGRRRKKKKNLSKITVPYPSLMDSKPRYKSIK
jgi:hypothetical protein